MKTKILSLFAMAVLALFLCLTFVSAATEFSVLPSTITFTPSDSSEDITITNTNTSTALTVTLSLPTINGISFTSSQGTTIIIPIGNTTNTTTIAPTTAIDFSTLGFGESVSGNLTITDGTGIEIVTVKIENNQFCEYDNPGKLEVKSIDFNNLGIGTEGEWYPYDVIEVEIEIENNDNDDDIEDITLEWGLYDSDGEWIIEPVEEDEFDVDADEKEIITFEVDLNDDLDVELDELKDGSYEFYVRVTGDIEGNSEDKTCHSDSESIDVIIEKNYVILTELEVVGTPYCGSTIQVKANVINIGEKDQDSVYVDIYNSDLGVDEQAMIGDIDAFDDKTLNFEFTIPTNLDEKTYTLHLDVYDEDDDIYENSNDDKSKHALDIMVSGNCVKVANVVVYASLESGGKAGQEMQIKASVTNTGSEKQTFTVDAADYSNWAELVSIEPSSLTLDEDEDEDVLITLNVNSDAPEKSTFSIVVEDEDGKTVTQPVSVTIEKGFSLKGLFGDKGYIWALVLLNVILIIVVVVVAVRISRR